MAKPSLPSRPDDTWEGGFFFDATRDVRAVSARGGLVIAGGDDLFMLRPGAQRMAFRPSPLDIGPIRIVAAEPRGARRYAVASDEVIAIFYKTKQGDQILRLRPMPPGPGATHLAWAAAPGGSTLYIRREDGAVMRLNHDLTDMDELSVAPMDAIAADDAGGLALASLDDERRVYVMRDGLQMHYRALDVPFDASTPVHLAVAGMAVAIAVEDGGAFLSRSEDDAFAACAALGAGGPLEFEGPESDAALFGAVHEPEGGALVRVDRAGAAMRVAEFGTEGGGEQPRVGALSWDESRGTLWGALPHVGLVMSTAPRKGRKKVILS
jgi:hypothetical protein